MLKTLSQNTFGRPAKRGSLIERIARDARYYSPLSQREGTALKRQTLYGSSVARLLFGCSPSAVVRRIGSVIVDPVNGMARRRLWSHISQKVWKSFWAEPSIVNRDAPATVVIVLRGIRVKATRPEAYPCSILLRVALRMFGYGVSLETATRAGKSGIYTRDAYGNSPSAVTPKHPLYRAAPVVNKQLDLRGKSAKSPAGYVRLRTDLETRFRAVFHRAILCWGRETVEDRAADFAGMWYMNPSHDLKLLKPVFKLWSGSLAAQTACGPSVF